MYKLVLTGILLLSTLGLSEFRNVAAEAPATWRTTQVLTSTVRSSKLLPTTAKLCGNTMLVPLRNMIYFGFTPLYSAHSGTITLWSTNVADKIVLGIGRNRATRGKQAFAVAAPRMVSIRVSRDVRPIAYPYVPLYPLAEMGGAAVTRLSTKPDLRLVISRPAGAPDTPLAWQLLIGQRLMSTGAQQDKRIRVIPSFAVDSSRLNDYASRRRYIAMPAVRVEALGDEPVLTGSFALFLQTDDGRVYGAEHMTQSFGALIMARLTRKETFTFIDRPLIPLSTQQRVKWLIYFDGFSYFRWEIAHWESE